MLIEQSLAARPELSQARAAARAERARVPQVGAPPDPMLELGIQNDSFTSWEIGEMEMSWYSIMASQTIPWPGKLRLQRQIAELGAQQADQNVARVALATEAEVRRAYLDLMLARDRLGLLDRLEALARRTAAVAKARYETGTAVQSELLRAQLELKRIRQRRLGLALEAETARQTLNRLRGHPLDESIEPPLGIADLALPRLPAGAAALRDALDRSPELASARAGTRQGQRTTALARKGYLPDVTLRFGVMPRGGGFPTMWLASVGIPLPVYAASKQRRLVAETRARLAASESGARSVEQILSLRVEQRRSALAAALETIRLYRDGLLAESAATAESTLAQYEVGQVSFLAVLEANVGLVADQDGYLQLLAQAQRLQIDAAEVSLDPVGTPAAGMGTSSLPSPAMGSGVAPAGGGMAGGGGMPAGSPSPASAPSPGASTPSSGSGTPAGPPKGGATGGPGM